MFTFSRSAYESVLKVLAVISSIIMMYISAQFSVEGFSFQTPDKIYIGWMLAVILIIVEMILNNGISTADPSDAAEARRMTILIIAGLVAYVYGISTNISGILHSGRVPDNPLDYLVPVALGLFLEIVPEPLMVWAMISKEKPKSTWKPQQSSYATEKQGSYTQSNPSIFSDHDVRSKLPRRK